METVEAEFPPCPECQSEFTYESGALLTCPMCGHEWAAEAVDVEADVAGEQVIRDANGNELADGDDVTIVKTVKISGGAGAAIKIGTKVRGIRLLPDATNGHDIDAKIPGLGKIQLKSSIVKKS